MNRILALILAAAVSGTALADNAIEKAGNRVGLGQDSAKEPPMLKNMRLTDPLVQQKYLNEPDMLRFLRATYSEGCSRGMLNKAVAMVKLDKENKFAAEGRDAAKKLADSQRIWKMSSFEMEALFGAGYLKVSYYCDCLMKEVPDVDLVNPKKGIEVIEKLPTAVQTSCERIAQEKAERVLAGKKENKE